jgi:electron transfer flavoprotein beta subunit
MEILVCARRVPDTSENEISLNSAGNDIERDELVYSVNEADNYAVEEALQIRDRVGGNVTVVTVDSEDGEEILRRQLAMGANQAALVSDDAFNGSDGRGIATILKAFVEKGHYDLILTGVQADDGAAQVGGMLAAMLDYPYASLVNSIAVEGTKLKVSREIEGGNREINENDLPCVL